MKHEISILTEEEKEQTLEFHSWGWSSRAITDRILENRKSSVYYKALNEVMWVTAGRFHEGGEKEK